jgi:hypothetical protein
MKEGKVKIMERHIKGDLVKELRLEGFKILLPAWPKYLVISNTGELIFTALKKQGERLSKQQNRTMSLLIELGFKAQVIYQQPIKLVVPQRLSKEELEREEEEAEEILFGKMEEEGKDERTSQGDILSSQSTGESGGDE